MTSNCHFKKASKWAAAVVARGGRQQQRRRQRSASLLIEPPAEDSQSQFEQGASDYNERATSGRDNCSARLDFIAHTVAGNNRTGRASTTNTTATAAAEAAERMASANDDWRQARGDGADENVCMNNVIRERNEHSNMAWANNWPGRQKSGINHHLDQQQPQNRQRRRKNDGLTCYLMYLFGSVLLLLLLVVASATCSSGGNSSSTLAESPFHKIEAKNMTTTMTMTTATTEKSFPLVDVMPEKVNSSSEESHLKEADNEKEVAASNDEDEEEIVDEPNSPLIGLNGNDGAATGGGRGKLNALIVDTASSGVDTLVERLRAARDREPVESNEDDNGGDSEMSETSATSVAKPQSSAQHSSESNQTLKSNSSASAADKEEAEQLKLAFETYGRWRTTGDDLIELFSRKLLPIVMEHGYDIDPVTLTGLLQVFNGIRAIKPWALKLLDASAKISPGILVGTQSDFGDFDECLSVRVDDPSGLSSVRHQPQSPLPPLKGEDQEEQAGVAGADVEELDPQTGLRSSTVVGRYCLADIEFPKPPRKRLTTRNEELQTDWAPVELRNPLLNFSESAAYRDTIFVETGNFFHMLYVDPIRVGICLTNKIDPDSFASVVNKLLEDFRVTIHFRNGCVTKYDKPTWSVYQRVSAYVLLVACSLVCLSTLLDIAHSKLNKLPCPECLSERRTRLHTLTSRYRQLFTSFSIIRNTKRLFKSQQQLSYQQQHLRQANKIIGHQYNLNLHLANSGANAPPKANTNAAYANTNTNGSIAESSAESSPSIERRGSAPSVDGSSVHLISSDSYSSTSVPFSHSIKKRGSAQPLVAADGSSSSNTKTTPAAASYYYSSSDNNIMQQQRHRGQSLHNLDSLHGVRVITMTWMIVNHTYLFGGFFVLWAHRRLIDIAEWPKSLSFQLVLNGWLTVETYFFLSALIIVLNVLPLMRRRKFGYPSYIIHRLIRLMPAYVGLVCLNFLWPLISSGPVWLVKGRSFIQTPCENNLWTNFLFINNWIWPERQCMVHTWFLSADFQLYLLAPIIVYALYRRPALGHSLNLIVAIIASVLSGFVIYANKLMPSTLINKLEFDSIKQQLSYSYFATYQHVGPYCLGILTGYIIYKRPNICLPKHLSWSLWLLLPPLSFTTLLLTYLWNGAYDDPAMINPSPIVSAVYVAIHRTIWTSLVAWIVFACTTGRAKLLSNFLSNSFFIPLSRLSFSIYLVHLPVIMFRALNLRHTIEWTDSNILWEACGNYVTSIIMAYFLNIAFESPMINLERVIFGRQSVGANNDNVDKAANNHRDGDSPRNSIATDGALCSAAAALNARMNSNNIINCNVEEGEKDRGAAPEDILRYREEGTQSMNSATAFKPTATENDLSVMEKSIESSSQESIVETTIQGRPVLGAERRRGLSTNVQQVTNFSDDSEPDSARDDESCEPNNNLDPADEMRFTNLHPHQRQPLRTKESSVEKIFGRSNLPGSGGSGGDFMSGTRPRSNTLTTSDLIERRRRQQLLVERRLRAKNSPNYALNNARGHEDTYNISGEYQHYAPGSYQQWRMRGNNTTMRPAQYATLARSNRLGQDPLLINDRFENQSARLEEDQQQHHRHRMFNDEEIDQTVPFKPRSYLGATASERNRASSLGYDLEWNAHSTIYNEGRVHPRMVHRRPGRYNTLTGTGTSDWRLQRSAIEDHQWRRGPTPMGRDCQQEPTIGPQAASWLQPGALLPRIDSSTLRRQSRLSEAVDGNLIVEEEPMAEENSAL